MTLVEFLYGGLWTAAGGWSFLTVVGMIDHAVYPPLRVRPRESKRLTEAGTPRVSVIIPARNEERNIGRCVRSVQAQLYENIEIIVLDDQSEDRTGAVVEELAASDSRVRLIRGKPLPRGWVGKGWALCQGHRAATGQWILLLDADTEMMPGAIHTCVDYALEHKIDFLNPTPRFINRSFWEKALQPLLWGLVMTRFPMMWVNQRWLKENMAFGPFLLIRSDVYNAVDGHRRVCHDILEDVALSRLIKDSGFHTRIVNGMHLFNIRMYENFAQILQGWIKTAYGAMNYNLGLMALAVVMLFLAALFPLLMLPAVLVGKHMGNEALTTLYYPTIFAVLGLYSRRLWDHFRFGFSYVSLWMHPISMFVIQYMQVAAVWRFYFGELTWKGRAYRPGDGIMPDPTEFDVDKDERTVP